MSGTLAGQVVREFFLQVLYPDVNACVVARDAAVHSALVDGEGRSAM